MSSQCRALRTAIMTGEAKLLIVVGCATVAEKRHEYLATSHPNNKHKQAKVNAASRCGAKTSSTAALKKMTGGTVLPIDSCRAYDGLSIRSVSNRAIAVAKWR